MQNRSTRVRGDDVDIVLGVNGAAYRLACPSSLQHIFQIMSSGLFLAISYCTVMVRLVEATVFTATILEVIGQVMI